MTFEEFFIKKKIDLTQLKIAEPELFLEFKSHFTLMGEKSFDQVKKFWFNKLRRAYHLQDAPKAAKETIIKEKLASQAEPLSSPTLDQKPEDFPASKSVTPHTGEAADQTEAPEKPALKPKFTPRNIPSKPKGTVIGELPQEEVKKEDAAKPAASFKPRFNPKNIKPKDEPDTGSQASGNKQSNEEGIITSTENGSAAITDNPASIPPEESKEPTTKESFKPRFNMKNIKRKEQSMGTENQEEAKASPTENKIETTVKAHPATEAANETKAAYKPRFNMKNVQKKEESGISIPASAPETSQEENKGRDTTEAVNTPKKDTSPNSLEGEAPIKAELTQAYKPRFKMKNVQQKEESGVPIPASAPETSGEAEESPVRDKKSETNPGATKKEEPSQKEETKPVYKPRFKMKNIKPKSED